MTNLEIYLYVAGYIYVLAMETGKDLIRNDRITAFEVAENVVWTLVWPITAPAFVLGKMGAVIARHVRKRAVTIARGERVR